MATIEEREDGPLVVKDLTSMTGPAGEAIEPAPVVALCRCGLSANKPYCDGSHRDAGFKSRDDTPLSGKDRTLTYEGADVTVTYNPMMCSHAAECGRLASHIFNPAQKPWVQPDKGTVEEVRSVVAACPSGALQLEHEGVVVDETRSEVTVERNGPYWVTGVAPPVPPQGDGMSTEKFVLCRCGMSGNKPFCDGSHRDKKWSDGS